MSRNLPDLVRIFDSLPSIDEGAGEARFNARPVPGIAACSVAKDSLGLPVLIVETAGAPRRSASPLQLENLSVLHDVDCRLQLPDGDIQVRRASIVRCTDLERVLHEYFLRALVPVLLALPENPTRQQVRLGVDTLVALFRQASQPPSKTIMGLWAELFVIAMARDPGQMIGSWHAIPEDRFDFSQANQRLEVKAAAGRIRSHRFALDQLRTPGGTIAVIASILVERAGAGDTVTSLVERIRSRVPDPELLIRLDNTVAQTLGHDWRQASTIGFDYQLAESSLRYFESHSLPAPLGPLPPEISDVHFRADLTHSTPANPRDLLDRPGLIAAAIPNSFDD